VRDTGGIVKLRSALLFASIWVGVLLSTVGIRTLQADAGAEEDGNSKLDQRSTSAIRGMAAKNIAIDVEDFMTSDPKFFDAVHQTINGASAKLRACAVDAMRRSSSESEFFDVSFLVMGGVPDELKLSQVIVERSTTPFLKSDEKCIVDSISGLGINSLPFIAGRIRFPMCFNRNKK
jgi:hypothetical protein